MRFYCTKTGNRYESPPLLIVGDVAASVRTITAYGFFKAMIHVDDGGAVPTNRQFIVAEKTPPDWTGETITADRFKTTMDARTIKPGEKQKMPSLLQQAANFTGTMIDFAKDGFRTVDDAERTRRLEVCQTCERFTGQRCSSCGCFTNFKSWIGVADCPLGKWGETKC
jgi:hypothetical protein